MKLKQLAVKLSCTQEELAVFFSARGLEIDQNIDKRLNREYIDIAIRDFSKEDTHCSDQPPLAEKGYNHDELENSLQEEIPLSTTVEAILIKAPKVDLRGLKIIGKMDVPMPLKKPDPKSTGDYQNQTRSKNVASKKSQLRSDKKEKTLKNPLEDALQQEQKRKNLRKEWKKNNYQRRWKHHSLAQSVSDPKSNKMEKVNSATIKNHAENEVVRTMATKGWLERFFSWFITP